MTSLSNPLGKTRKSERLIRLATAVIGSLLAGAAGYFALHQPGTPLQQLSYDIPFVVHRAGASDEIRILYLDDLEGELLNRRVQPQVLDRLNEAGARAVIYDVIFDKESEPPEIDQEFAAAIRRFRGVDDAGETIPGKPSRKVLFGGALKSIEQTGVVIQQMVGPTDVLWDSVGDEDVGLVAFVTDRNFTVRELVTGTRDEPSLSWKAALALGAPLKDSERIGSRWLNFGGRPPAYGDKDGAPAFRACTASDLLEGANPGFFRDKIVIVGAKPGIVGAELGKDLFSTPFHTLGQRGVPFMSGVELQANALDNLLRGNWLTRSSERFDTILVIVAGILAGAGFTRPRPLRGILLALGIIVLLIAAGVLAMHFQRFWFPWSVVAFLQVPIAVGWGTGSRFYVERFFRVKLSLEQQQLRAAFSKYLSPQMLDKLTADNFKVNLGGQDVKVAMMFTDIADFTTMCQRVRRPDRIVALLNEYFQRTTANVFDHDGIIIKYIGDAIFAAWGTPLADPEAPIKAVRAAWDLFKSDKLVVDGQEHRTRIGLNYGDVVAGNIGSEQRVDFTLIGDAANLAARLEGMNKMLGTHILLSDDLRREIGEEFLTRRVGRFVVKGRSEVTVVHELLGPALDEGTPDWIASYHRALDALEAGDFAAARERFTAVDALRGRVGDGPSRFFLEAIEGADVSREGVVELKEK